MWPQASNYKLVQGRKGRRRCLHARVEIPAPSRMGPGQAPGWEGEPCTSSHSQGVKGAAASLSLTFPHLSTHGWD